LGITDPTKPTIMNVNDSGDVDGTLAAILGTSLGSPSSNHKAGPATYNFQSTGDIGTDGRLTGGAAGGTSNDNVSVSYSGTNNGEIDVDGIGNGGNDQINIDVAMLSGSTGNVGASTNDKSQVSGGTGKNVLRFTIERGTDTTSTTGIFAELNSTSKKD